MQAIVLHHPGGPEALIAEEVPTPTVKPGWSLIRVRGFGINRSEIFTRNGWSPSVRLPRILGIECVGEIAATTDSARLPLGHTVVSAMGGLGREFNGSYAEYTLVPNGQIYPITTALDWAHLAAIPETYFTAYGSLLSLKLTSNDQLLIRGATSGVGSAAAKLAHALAPGITVTGTTRDLAKADKLRAHGFDNVVLDQNNQLQVFDRRFTKILDLIGPLSLIDTMRTIAPHGIVCMTGELGGVWELKEFDPITDIPHGAYLTGFSSDDINETAINALFSLISTNNIDVTPTQTFDLAHTAAAQAFLDSHDSFGKVVVLP